MSNAPSLPSYSGVKYPEGMNPFKAGSLLFKVATQGVGNKKKIQGKVSSQSPSKSGKSKSGLSKSTVRTITTIKK